jgi:hypothetical protein
MSNLHGEFLSIHKISQAEPGVPKIAKKTFLIFFARLAVLCGLYREMPLPGCRKKISRKGR